jgi:cysteine desulfurase/selenocysteine lyase
MALASVANVRSAASWRLDFPALEQSVHGTRLAYLDSAATALVPRPVIDAMVAAYTHAAGAVHRGVHALAEAATLAFDAARADIAAWLGVPADEIVLTYGTTDTLSGIAQGWVRPRLAAGDAMIVSELEHHANLVPWQRACAERAAELRVCRIDDAGVLDVDHLEQLLADRRVRAVAITQLSNVTGTAPPLDAIMQRAHARGAIVIVDGAQGVAHLPPTLAGDFYACSGHKLYGPGGTGILWAKRARLEELAPWRTGGGMVARVDYQHARFREPPARFEAGTPNVAGVIGLAAAARYLAALGPARLDHEQRLHARLVGALREIRGVRVLGEPRHALASFVVDGVHPHDLASVLDRDGVAIRAGHHCAQPLHARLGVDASTRASLGLYSDDADIAALVAGIEHAKAVLA